MYLSALQRKREDEVFGVVADQNNKQTTEELSPLQNQGDDVSIGILTFLTEVRPRQSKNPYW